MTNPTIEDVKSKLQTVFQNLRQIADEVEELYNDLCEEPSISANPNQYGGWKYGIIQTKSILDAAESEHAEVNG